MAQDIVNENQKISYTNLDFSAIYTETLDLIKKLTYKWDPSISDESDPGVILVKLSALIADKLNYNIDKNVLETFPLSVTQDGNARQLYDQLGYYMDWYQSGQTSVAITWVGTNENSDSVVTYKMPKFTPICDTEQSANKRYTIIGVEGAEDKIVSDIFISTDGSTVVALAMEGFPVQYQFEGETVITSQMVDPISRRLYFTSKYISQNGVFIKNTGQDNYAEWKRVNNLYENSFNELRYIFGYDSQSDTCYLEFPDNYAELIGSGIEITYLLIDPSSGDVMSQELTQLMSTIQASVEGSEDNVITLSNDNINIINYLPSSGHADIEGIDEAYVNYKRTVGTFKTLITLRDYLNYIRNEDLDVCSNAFVCDRTNDVQSVYKIMNKGKDLTNLVVKVEQLVEDQAVSSVFDYRFIVSKDSAVDPDKTYYTPSDDGNYLIPVDNPTGIPAEKRYYELESIEPKTEDALGSFTLKFYMLRKSVSLDSLAAYNQTFTMLNPYPDFDSLFSDTSHLEHVYGDILPLGKNIYKKSTDEEWSSTKSYWLYDTEEQTYSLVTNLSDYAETSPAELSNIYDIKIEALMPHVIFFKTLYPVMMNVSTYSVFDSDTQDIIRANIINSLYRQTSSSEMNFGEEVSIDYLSRIVRESDTRIKSVAISPLNYYLYATYFDEDQQAYIELRIDDDMGGIEPESYQSATNIIASQIKKDIVAKSILAGTTQLIIPDTEFIYHLPQKFLLYKDDVVRVTPEATISIGDAPSSYSISNSASSIRKTYTLKDNEKITLFRPRLETTDEYLSGIHYEYLTSSEIAADSSYKLGVSEYFIFYTVNKNESDNGIESYTAHAFGPGKIISPTFRIPAQVEVSSLSNFARSQILPQFELDSSLQDFKETTSNNTFMTEIKNSSAIVNNTITGTDKVSIQEVNKFDVEIADKYKFYWILNRPTYSSNNNLKTYTLFGEYDSESNNIEYDALNSYTLKSGELLYYANERFTQGNWIGSGTTLRRNCGVETSQYSEIKNSIYYAEINHLASIVENSSFSALTDNDDVIRPREQGLYVVVDTTPYQEIDQEDNPFELGLYELYTEYDTDGITIIDEFYIPTLDTEGDASKTYYSIEFDRTEDITAVDTEHYYVLVMRKEPGYFYKSTYTGMDGIERQSYVADSLDSGCFEAVKLKDIDNPVIVNPVQEGYYKEAKYMGSYYLDTYSLASGVNETTQHRFTKAKDIFSPNNFTSRGNEYFEHDSSIFTRKILSDTIYPNVDISNPDTYVDMDLYKDNFSPVAQELLVPTEYATYYEDDNGTPGDEVQVTYLTNPYMDRLWVEDDNGYLHKCFDYANEPMYVHFSPAIKELKASTGLALFREVESTFSTTITNLGCYYKPNSASTVYRVKGAGSTVVPYSSAARVVDEEESPNSPLDHLYSLYAAAASLYNYDETAPTRWLEYINSRWTDSMSFQSPYIPPQESWNGTISYNYDARVTHNNKTYRCVVTVSTQGTWVDDEWSEIETCWRTGSFEEDTSETIGSLTSFTNKYALVDANSILDSQINVGMIYPAFVTDQTQSDNPKFFVEARFALSLGVSSDSHPYDKISEIGTLFDTDLKLMSTFPNVRYDIKEFATIQLYYMPKLYVFNDFVKYTDETYYVPKDLYKQHCGIIDAWTCTAEDRDSVLRDPESTIGTNYQSLQPDTSLTVIDNELLTFSVGDRLIFETEDISEESIDWPIFNNSETSLDLDHYKLYYIKNGSTELVEIKQLKIDDYTWKGYSSLIINASNRSGQKLEGNHTIEVYDDETDTEPIAVIDGSEGDNISIQFRDAIESQSGSFIDVTTIIDTTKETKPNAIYVFEPYKDGNYYKYGTIDYVTSLMFNSVLEEEGAAGEDNVYSPQEITIPFGLPGGEYLLGSFMVDGVDLEVVNNNYLNVDGIDYSLDAPVINDAGGIYSLDTDYINQLHSYMNEDRTKFTGDRYDYIYMNTGDGQYRKLIAPSLIAISKSPKEIGLYEEENGEFSLSQKEERGVELVIEAPAEIGMNPKELGWYEANGEYYSLTEDTEVETDEFGDITKTYYMEQDLYVDVSKVESSLTFTISHNGQPYTKQSVNYLLDDIFKFEPNSAIGNFDLIREKVQQLDVDEEYAYTYVPSSNDIIENPLEAKSFFNPNHVYNKFTIAQLDFENLDTRFTTIRTE